MNERKTKLGKVTYDFAICSRNLRIWTPDTSSYWKVAKKYDIENVLYRLIGDAPWVAIQGECVAPNVQGNKYHVTELLDYNCLYKFRWCR